MCPDITFRPMRSARGGCNKVQPGATIKKRSPDCPTLVLVKSIVKNIQDIRCVRLVASLPRSVKMDKEKALAAPIPRLSHVIQFNMPQLESGHGRLRRLT